ncbi:MAG: Trp biosynthesis-associated membrane protein [Rhodoglobus sp.]
MDVRRVKLLAIVAAVAFGGLTLIAWTQQWFTLTLTSGQVLTVAGQIAAPALSALGLASLALAAALAIAGAVLRHVLGALEVAIGGLAVSSAVAAVFSPVSASTAAVTAAVGESGATAVAALVSSVSVGMWPYLAVVLGVLSALVGVVVLATARRWPNPTRRYETASGETSAQTEADTTVSSWDALSEGRDPT